MAYVLTNGQFFISATETGKIVKTNSVMDAYKYLTADSAKEILKKATTKTKNYYIYDLDTCTKYQVTNNGKRIIYPKEIRQEIYDKAEGRCQLCGRKILYEEMTLDHITPLFFNGKDCVENLQCTCKVCNEFKSHILPEEFAERITDIFCYQMKKRFGKSLKWKFVHRVLLGMLGKI